MLTLVRSSVFSAWLDALQDHKGKALVLSRLANAALGNFGDCATVGEGVLEMRIHHGLDTVSISCAMARRFMRFCAVATRDHSGGTLLRQSGWRAV